MNERPRRQFKCTECEFIHPYWSSVSIHILYKHSLKEINNVFATFIEVVNIE